MDNRLEQLEIGVRTSISHLINHTTFKSWLGNQKKLSFGDLIQLNNSFLYRDRVKTTKSPLYMFIPIGINGEPEIDIQVGNGQSVNNDFGIVTTKSQEFPATVPLDKALDTQLEQLGSMALILAGSVADDVVSTAPVGHQLVKEIRLDPVASDLISIRDCTVTVRDTGDPDAIWDGITSGISNATESQKESLKGAVAQAMEKLDAEAYARLVLPGNSDSGASSVLADVVSNLKSQRDLYYSALSKCQGEPLVDHQEFNEVLRISYNFASDVTALINLIVSICDLKPIVLWGTIAEHYALSEAFRELPWVRSVKKASLKAYAQMIGDARNSAFHHLFPFGKSLEVQLVDGLKDVSLRLFSDHGKKAQNDLQYRDKELVEVLREFTRTSEKKVAPEFWQKNLDVIDCTISLFIATDRFLRSLAECYGTVQEPQAV